MATKIRLKRMGKKFYAFYRVVIMDSRTKRDGRAIEEIGTYNPNTQPSTTNSLCWICSLAVFVRLIIAISRGFA